MYHSTTHDITVSVESSFLDTESSPDENIYFWSYHVKIENNGKDPVTLRSRHWRITDAYGRLQEVRGSGVVGEQPRLNPGESFEYTSGTPLPTPSGIMAGSYQMEKPGGGVIEITIPAFSLDSPHQSRLIN